MDSSFQTIGYQHKTIKNCAKIVFLKNNALIVLNTYNIFEEATVDTLILIGQKAYFGIFPKSVQLISIDKNLISIKEKLLAIGQKEWKINREFLIEDELEDINLSFETALNLQAEKKLGDCFDFKFGVKPYQIGKGNPPQTEFEKENKIFHADKKVNDAYYPLIGAGDLRRYFIDWNGEWIHYGNHLAEPRDLSLFSNPRILLKRIISRFHFDAVYTEETLICNSDLITLSPKMKEKNFVLFYLAILSSKLCAKYVRSININLNREVFPKINTSTLLPFPVPEYDQNSPLVAHAELMLSFSNQLNDLRKQFTRLLHRRFAQEKLPQKLENWMSLTYAAFCAEVNKLLKTTQKRSLSLAEELEWEPLFEEQRNKAAALQADIARVDREIDAMVYALYGLTEEEVAIVEGK